jgi:hypothetical protein
MIVADLPSLLAEFGRKRFTLLWRGSRDGFGTGVFHGRAPALALIRARGEHFRGFTPVNSFLLR